MPPIPPTVQTLSARLNSLLENNKCTVQLIHRLAKLDFQPGSQPLENSEERDVRLELSAEIHESLKGVEEELELLGQEVEDIIAQSAGVSRRKDNSKDSEKSRLAVLLARLTEDLRLSRAQYRKAQLTAKRNADRAKLKERELLFSTLQSGATTPASYRQRKQTKALSEEEVVAQASSDVTSALRRTHLLMQNELSRSRFAQETLEQSTAALADLGEKYTDLTTLLANSRTLVSTLVKSNKSDTWYLETTFYILITTLVWLVFRRIFYGPLSWTYTLVSWFVIWPLKFFLGILFPLVPIGDASSTASLDLAPSSVYSSVLVIQPSASGQISTKGPNAHQPAVRVSGGGRGHQGNDPSSPNSYSQEVGQMAEQNRQQQDEVPDHPQFRQRNQNKEEEGEVRRGDGTVLKESDRLRNVKKKMWEEDKEAEKLREARVEQQRESTGRSKGKDEL